MTLARILVGMRRTYAALAVAVALVGTNARAQNEPYRDPARTVDERVRDLLGRMTLEEKFWQLYMSPGDLDDSTHDYSHGAFGLQIGMGAVRAAPGVNPARAHAERVNAIQRYFVEKTRLGIPILPFEEAVHGLVRDGATVFPAAIGLAATWDTSMMSRVAKDIALEARLRGIRDVLSPVVNIASDVRWGRVEETYGEDPFLTSAMGRVFVEAFEHAGIIATPKHFIANVGDGGRDSYPIDIDQRLLEELYFPPFRSLVRDAHARSVMTAYNSVDGSPATQNRDLLNGTLKRDWGFTGFVISDAAATGGATVLHMTEANTASATRDAYDAGLDVVFQSTWEQHRPYLAAFQRKLIPDSIIDAAVARVLRAKFEIGLFEHPYADPDSAGLVYHAASSRGLARAASRESIVLLRNERHALPLAKRARSIAVIGTDAIDARLGGYTAPNATGVSILAGIREAVGAASRVMFAPGPGRVTPEYVVVPPDNLRSVVDGRAAPGLHGEYFDNNALDGTPKVVRTDARVDFGWTLNSPARGIPFNWYSVRWTGTLAAPIGERLTKLGVEGNDGYRLYVDGKLLIDNWRKESYGTRLADVHLAPGSTHDIRLEYFESTGNARIKLVWDAGVPHDWRAKIDSAVSVARRSDVAVVVAGIEEGEFRDRSSLALPGHQEELIERVASAGKPVVVVLIGGSAITMSRWLDKVDGVIDVWYPGEEGGRAVADVLFGDYSPAGRLPVTFPMSEGQLPLTYNHKPTGRGDDYVDGTGMARFPFGFGLSYTSFEYSPLQLSDTTIAADGSTTVRVRVRNTGRRGGDEVVQLYVRDVLATVARPVMQLAGFTRVHLEPDEEREISFRVGRAQLQMLDRDMRWVVEPGTFRLMVGASSKDIRRIAELRVH
jgi:beta-glucosidase